MKIYAVGIGPGDMDYLIPKAKEIISDCDVIVGYTKYIELIADIIKGKEIIGTGMTGETERCEGAFAEARKGKKVAVVSGGDAGIYGMAGLLFELSERYPGVEIEVIPGITAAIAAASVLGSPLSNDFAAISLSDLMTPWEVIEKRLSAAAAGDFVICLYNPRSTKRSDYIERACDILLRHRPPETVCGYVKNALRKNKNEGESRICTLRELSKADDIDMSTTVIIGNSATKIIEGKLVTARGYDI